MLIGLLMFVFQDGTRALSIPEVTSSSGRYVAVLIGINAYEDKTISALRTPENDATAMADLLSGRYGFETTLLLGDQASEQGIRDALEALVSGSGDKDSILIYFGGHGVKGRGQTGYWLPVDARRGKESTYISNSDLLGYLKRMPARHALLVSDACFSGSFFSDLGERYGEPDFRDLYKRKSRWGFTSGNLTPVDDIASGSRHSAFAVHLLDFLRKNDEPYLTPRQIIGRITSRVARSSSTKQYPRAAPVREAGDGGGEFVFWLRDAVDGHGKAYPPPWKAADTSFLDRVLQELHGRSAWVTGGGERGEAICEKLGLLGLRVECTPKRKDRLSREISIFCSTVPAEAAPALLDYLGLRGYRIETHGNDPAKYDERDCGKFEIILWN